MSFGSRLRGNAVNQWFQYIKLNKLLKQTTMHSTLNTLQLKTMVSQRYISTVLFVGILFVLLSFLSTAASANTLTSSPNRTQLAMDETLELQVRYEGQRGGSGPDFSMLQKDFDILNQHRSNQFSLINGQRESYTQWTLTLAPKREGELLIPSFELNGIFSDAVAVTVKPAGTIQGGQLRDVFVESALDKSSAHIHEQAVLSLKLLSRYNLSDLEMSELAIDGAVLKVLGQQQYNKMIQGQRYLVLEVKYALFPEKAGTLNIPPVTFSATLSSNRRSMFDPWGSRGQVVRPRSTPLTLDVKPIPKNFPSNDWLPANGVSLIQKWSSDIKQITVGEPVTRTVTVQADGQESSRLPPLPTLDIPGLKQYPDQAQLNDETRGEQVTGTRKESTAWVATAPGNYVIPETVIHWWDNKSNQIRTAKLPKQQLTVIASAQSASQSDGSSAPIGTGGYPDTASPDFRASQEQGEPPAFLLEAETQEESFSHWIIHTILILANVLFIGLWLRERSKARRLELYGALPTTQASNKPYNQTIRQLARQVNSAANDNKPKEFRDLLIQWAQHQYGDSTIQGLRDIPCGQDNNQSSNSLKASLLQLDNALYGENTPTPDLKVLWQAVKQYADKPQAHTKNQGLKQLYANG